MSTLYELVLLGGDPNDVLRALMAQPEQLHDIACVAADKAVAMQGRLAALRGVVEASSVLDKPLPAPVVVALEDTTLVDAAIERRTANTIVAALHGLKSPALRKTREALIRKLVASGVRGINLAWLALDVDDHESAVLLATADFEENIAGRLGTDDPVVSAWVKFIVEAPEPVRNKFFAAIGAQKKDALLAHLRPEQRAKLAPQQSWPSSSGGKSWGAPGKTKEKRTIDLRTLSRACASGDLALVREHLDGGGDPNAGDTRSGVVILHDAAYFKQPEIVKALLAAGANPKPRDRDGREPLQLAIQFPPSGPIAMVIGGNFTVIDTPEARRDRAGQLAIVNMLLDAGASPNPEIVHALLFELPLEAAAKLGDLEIVQILLAREADPNRGSPLVDAINHGSADVVLALLEAGASPDQRQRGGATALLRSIDAIDNDNQTRMRVITKLLLRAGADRALTDDRGRTALDVARRRNTDERLVQLLTPKTAEAARATMLANIGNAAKGGTPSATFDVILGAIRAYAPAPGEDARTYAERIIDWSRQLLARRGLAPDERTFEQIRDATI